MRTPPRLIVEEGTFPFLSPPGQEGWRAQRDGVVDRALGHHPVSLSRDTPPRGGGEVFSVFPSWSGGVPPSGGGVVVAFDHAPDLGKHSLEIRNDVAILESHYVNAMHCQELGAL